jgi:hypothetical protein
MRQGAELAGGAASLCVWAVCATALVSSPLSDSDSLSLPWRLQRFYRLDVYCKPCPNLAWLLIVAFVVVITLMLLVGIWLNQRRVNLAALGIGVDFAQVPIMMMTPALLVRQPSHPPLARADSPVLSSDMTLTDGVCLCVGPGTLSGGGHVRLLEL